MVLVTYKNCHKNKLSSSLKNGDDVFITQATCKPEVLEPVLNWVLIKCHYIILQAMMSCTKLYAVKKEVKLAVVGTITLCNKYSTLVNEAL